MELSELVTYARDKYGIEEEHKWTNFPGFSVLCHPETGKWVALLIRQWDTDSGTEIQHCDLKCGLPGFLTWMRPWIGDPVRMTGDNWVGISFTRETEPATVFRLFDRAIANGNPPGATIVIEAKPSTAHRIWQDTVLPFTEALTGMKKPGPPEKLRQMRRLYEYGRDNAEVRAKNFYRQGKFMEDYTDDYPWEEDFVCYYPTYHDMTTRQLRGYFSWRTDVRKGCFYPISTSAAYLYIYELLNGIGADTPGDALTKLKEFEAGYLDAGLGDSRMQSNLRRWMLDLAVVGGLPAETARQYADPELMRRDQTLGVLRHPSGHSDEEVFSALIEWGGKKYGETPVMKTDAERGRRLFSEAWRFAAAGYTKGGRDLFTLCFGLPPRRRYEPFSNAVYFRQGAEQDCIYRINECRSYTCEGGEWSVSAFEKLYFDRERLQGFLHQTDLMLRRYLKTGRYLKEKAEDVWASPYIAQAIGKDRQAVLEAARPKITLDLDGLDKIRRDALTTQTSLLTEEERGLAGQGEMNSFSAAAGAESDIDQPGAFGQPFPAYEAPAGPGSVPSAGNAEFIPPSGPSGRQEAVQPVSPPATDLSLDAVHLQILRTLLSGSPVDTIIRDNRLMPSIVADAINEALFDEIGDTVVSCDDDTLSLVEDYKEDLVNILGG